MYQACLSQLNIWRLQAINWFKEEKGANEVIAVILILVVVVALAVIFREKIVTLATNLFKDVDTSTTNFNAAASPGPTG